MDLAPPGLTPTQRHVLLVLADHVDDSTGVAWPSVARLCARTSLSRRTVQRSLRDLEQAHIIAPTGPARLGERSTSTRYRWLADPARIVSSPAVDNPVDNAS